MSTVSVSNLKNAASATNNLVLAADGSVSILGGAVSPYTGMRNRIINGAMTIDQRNAGASVTQSSSLLRYPVDRTFIFGSVDARFTAQQNAGAVTPPLGFTNYVGATVASALSVSSSDYFFFEQRIEGFNVSDFNWGAANAQTVTLSFWVRSSITGTHSGVLQNGDFSRTYPFVFTISAANTWEYKTVTILGDTTGTWNKTNGNGLVVRFNLGAGSSELKTAGAWSAGGAVGATGSVSVVGTSGATFYITGCQLEVGSVATPFEFRSIGTELGLAQRYYETGETFTIGYGLTGTNIGNAVFFKTTKRSAPTIVQTSTSAVNVSATPQNTQITVSSYTSFRLVTSTTQSQFSENYTASAEL